MDELDFEEAIRNFLTEVAEIGGIKQEIMHASMEAELTDALTRIAFKYIKFNQVK